MIDSVLFSAVVLGGLLNKDGDIWRRQSTQICVVECTLSSLQSKNLAPLNWHMKQPKVTSIFDSSVPCIVRLL